jgi:phospholipid transport system substrate-binding protein
MAVHELILIRTATVFLAMRLATLMLSLLLSVPALGQDLGPDELVRKVTADVLDAIKSDKQLQAGDRKKALALAEQKILPHVDFRDSARLAVGKAWQGATPEQQDRIVNEFRSMLVRIYSNAIDVYRGQTMKVLPVRLPPGATEVTVRNQYLSAGQPPVPVDYAMKKTPEGWMIYDITVDGVSLVLTYRTEFEQVTKVSGVDGLIKRLKEKNA